MSDALGAVLILAGSVLAALAGLGQLRFKDLFVRMHVATKPSTLGLLLIAAGAMFRIDAAEAIPVLVLIISMQFLTAPVAAHLIARAAHRRGEWERDDVVMDDLADVDEL